MVNGTYTVPIEVFDMASSSIPQTMFCVVYELISFTSWSVIRRWFQVNIELVCMQWRI